MKPKLLASLMTAVQQSGATPAKIGVAVALALSVPVAKADVDYYTSTTSTDWSTDSNWSTGSTPSLSTGGTAVINNGANVVYTAGDDLRISVGGVLEVSNGSWTQTGGVAWIQLAGTATLRVDGGTFNMGTSAKINVTNSGNKIEVSAGALNITTGLAITSDLSYVQSGGTVSIAGELDIDASTASMSGGILNTTLITTVNADTTATFTLSGGVINLSSATGIYGNTLDQINFTVGSTGEINFTGGTTLSAVEAMITNGVIQYNNTIDSNLSIFNVTQSGDVVTVELAAVPEPSTASSIAIGLAGLGLLLYKRNHSRIAF
ncbi:MAG: hypothetical protein ACFUZC_15165 [Chthoniobacteraceae bacterium]